MALDAIHHVAVSVSDVPAAVAWYTTQFKCSVAYQDPTWALLDFENMQLALVIPGQHPPHISIVKPEGEITPLGPLTTHRDGTRSRYQNDPAGNVIELLADGPEVRRKVLSSP